jgi:hypothetical protein
MVKRFTIILFSSIFFISSGGCQKLSVKTFSFDTLSSPYIAYNVNNDIAIGYDSDIDNILLYNAETSRIMIHSIQDQTSSLITLENPTQISIGLQNSEFCTLSYENHNPYQLAIDSYLDPTELEGIQFGFPVNCPQNGSNIGHHGTFLSFTLSFYNEDGVTQLEKNLLLDPLTISENYFGPKGSFHSVDKGVYLPSNHFYHIEKAQNIPGTHQFILLMCSEDDRRLLYLDFDQCEATLLSFDQPIKTFTLYNQYFSVMLSSNESYQSDISSFSAKDFFEKLTIDQMSPCPMKDFSSHTITDIVYTGNQWGFLGYTQQKEWKLWELKNDSSTETLKEIVLPDSWKPSSNGQFYCSNSNIYLCSLENKILSIAIWDVH